jgi:hypothetical protein
MDWSVGRCGWYCFASLQGAQSEWAVQQARHAHACGTLNTLRTSCVACAQMQATSRAAVPTGRTRTSMIRADSLGLKSLMCCTRPTAVGAAGAAGNQPQRATPLSARRKPARRSRFSRRPTPGPAAGVFASVPQGVRDGACTRSRASRVRAPCGSELSARCRRLVEGKARERLRGWALEIMVRPGRTARGHSGRCRVRGPPAHGRNRRRSRGGRPAGLPHSRGARAACT